ncbi:stress-inducible protein [Streptomyces daqingensis]|jgi:nucleotide-binding universal stress UspA family protein|uniref:Stress-inducible protein n=1 Tax=Streptomyces daqingensis TaxID=1472640 RepID=A0ABQ2MEF2_9ACTN|nr:universal stress protein [Streptomyces daqingensis]GGO50304.1 stress-inducible protein [Streptomyces daqingensis]
MTESVTVGVDGTRESHSAVDWAAREALTRGVPLQLLHIREAGAYPYSPIADDEVEREWAQNLVNEVLDELNRRAPELNVEVEMAAGRPSHVLADASAETGLLVLGSRGLSSLLGFIVGSAALPTVAHCACPVVLVRAHAGDAHSSGDHQAETLAALPLQERTTTGEIVLGVDLRHPCDELMAFAFQEAALHSLPLRVLNAWSVGDHHRAMRPSPIPPAMQGELLAAQNDALTAALRPWSERYPDIKVHAEALTDQPAHLLVEAAAQASMLVVGRRNRRSRIGTHVGSVTHAVMHHARAPLAVVPYG